ncbi:MAG: winged helix-turn-helix transcriptional regulator [Phycisphaerales bacterium]|nr:MAG: winged helix-turn-helix transcriptional regulator [Phycisphaerales bacterium]
MSPNSSSSVFGSGSGKIDQIVRHGVHAIATGRWVEGHRLPSVREAEELWGVNRLTVLRAYQRLAEMGLVRNEPRRGFFVTAGPRVERVSRHRVEMDRLYETVRDQIRRDTGLSPLGAFRYLADLALTRARQDPECAFVECTGYQAGSHAKEITARLGLPCLALTTTGLAGNRLRIPQSVHILLTTSFHRAEVMVLADPPRLAVAEVPVELTPEWAAQLSRQEGPIVMLGVSQSVVEQLAQEVMDAIGDATAPIATRVLTTDQLEGALEELMTAGPDSPPRPMVLLTPTLWDAAGAWRDHERILPVEYRIREDAWPATADALGLPLGAVIEP